MNNYDNFYAPTATSLRITVLQEGVPRIAFIRKGNRKRRGRPVVRPARALDAPLLQVGADVV